MITYEKIVTACIFLSIAAVICSVVTIITGNWRMYLPTIIFGTAAFALSAYGMIMF